MDKIIKVIDSLVGVAVVVAVFIFISTLSDLVSVISNGSKMIRFQYLSNGLTLDTKTGAMYEIIDSPHNVRRRELYNSLSRQGAFTGGYEDFTRKFSDPSKYERLYNALVSEGEFTGNLEDFQGKFFSGSPDQEYKLYVIGIVED